MRGQPVRDYGRQRPDVLGPLGPQPPVEVFGSLEEVAQPGPRIDQLGPVLEHVGPAGAADPRPLGGRSDVVRPAGRADGELPGRSGDRGVAVPLPGHRPMGFRGDAAPARVAPLAQHGRVALGQGRGVAVGTAGAALRAAAPGVERVRAARDGRFRPSSLLAAGLPRLAGGPSDSKGSRRAARPRRRRRFRPGLLPLAGPRPCSRPRHGGSAAAGCHRRTSAGGGGARPPSRGRAAAAASVRCRARGASGSRLPVGSGLGVFCAPSGIL
jgi:hypothetical protein